MSTCRHFVPFLFFIAVLTLSANAADIRSVATGGNWSATTTWVGGVVPGPTDDVTINGTVAASNATVRSVTVTAGATLTGMNGPQYITVTQFILNNGAVVVNADNWTFGIRCQNSATNNGRWEPTTLEFRDGTAYTISGTGMFAGGRINKQDDKPLTLASDVVMGSFMYLAKPDWSWSTVNLASHHLTLDGSPGIYASGYVEGGLINGPGSITIRNGGLMRSTLVTGSIDLYGKAVFGAKVSFEGTLTNHDTLTGFAGPIHLEVKGKLINRGTIVRHPDNWNLSLDLDADIENYGIWDPTETVIESDRDVSIFHLPANPIEGDKFYQSDTVGSMIARSDLEFRSSLSTNAINYLWGRLDMRGHTLTLDARRGAWQAGQISSMIVTNIGSIVSRNGGTLSKVSLQGTVHLRGYTIIGQQTYAEGTVIVHDTLEGASGPNTFEVWGSLRNEGLIRQNAGNWNLNIIVHGDLTEAGETRDARVIIRTDGGTRLFTGSLQTGLAVNYNDESAEGSVVINSDARVNGKITLPTASTLRIPENAHLRSNYSQRLNGTLDLRGRLTEERVVSTTAEDFQLITARIKIPASSGVDSLHTTCVASGTPQTFGGAVNRWWTLEAFDAPSSAVASSMRLYLGDARLNGNEIATLQVYHSTDEGSTWSQRTTSLSITRNESERWIEFQDAPLSGQYVLASKPDPISVLPGVLVNIVGSDAVRIGAPNRISIVATNVGTSTTPSTLLPVFFGSRLHILGGELPLTGGGSIALSREDLIQGDDDSTMMMVVAPLEPGEDAVVDVIITADGPPGISIKDADNVQLEPVTTMIAGSIILWVGGKAIGYVVGKGIDYLGDKAQENIELSDAELKAFAKALNVREDQIRIRKTKDGIKMEAVKFTGGEVTTTLLKGGLPTGVALAIGDNMAKKVAPSLRQRVFNWFYKETALIKPEPPVQAGRPANNPQISSVAVKQGRAVTSRDPNDKSGISGFGDEGFIRPTATMHYRIRFENVKDAEAAAYRIVVIDTLDASVFNVSSARMRRTSHTGATFTQEGPVLRWEWIGIDLPPNVNPPEGEGYIDLSVDLKEGLQAGTGISNHATITFDLNDPIVTNTWTNTLDDKAPQTTGLTVRLVSSDTVECSYVATDQGAGVSQSSVFVSDGSEGGIFSLASTMPYNGDPVRFAIPTSGISSLRFYALSADFVGNAERVPSSVVSITSHVSEERLVGGRLRIRPMPASVDVVVSTSNGLPIGEYWVFDVTGRVVRTGLAQQETSIDVGGLPPGAYQLVTASDRAAIYIAR